jgi:hypothetical protein
MNDESSIQMVAQKKFEDLQPVIWLWSSRITAFIWCYAYHNWQSVFILFWVMHSTLFFNTQRFVSQTIFFYLPIFVLIFLFYYVCNIPKVFEILDIQDEIILWRNYGIFEFTHPLLEVSLMFTFLLPFFFLIKSRKYIKKNEHL